MRDKLLIINKPVVKLRTRVRFGPSASCTLTEGIHRELFWEPRLSLSAHFHCYSHLVQSLARPRLLLVSHINPGLPAGPVCPAHFVVAAPPLSSSPSTLLPPPFWVSWPNLSGLLQNSVSWPFPLLPPDGPLFLLFPCYLIGTSPRRAVCHLAEVHVCSDFPRFTTTTSLLSITAREGRPIERVKHFSTFFSCFRSYCSFSGFAQWGVDGWVNKASTLNRKVTYVSCFKLRALLYSF